MRRVKGLLRLGVCTAFLICLMYGLPACEKKEAPEQAQEKTQEMMKGSATKMVPEIQEKVEEAEEKVEEMVEEGKEEVEEMHEMMEGSGAKMHEAPDVMEEGSGAKKGMEGSRPKE